MDVQIVDCPKRYQDEALKKVWTLAQPPWEELAS